MLTADALETGYGGTKILHGVSLESRAGEITCLLGRNGAGKTTALKCLMGLLPAWSGTVRLRGDIITNLAAHQVARRGIGYVPEERLIFPDLTVAENLAMGARHGCGAEDARARLLDLFPRLKDRLGAAGRTLSGGEQQMLSIARALMAGPKLLLVDEPTEGLAPVMVQALERGLRALAAAGTTILVVESKLAVARRIADRIFVMAKGRCVFDGTPDELQHNQDIRREYLEV